MAIKVGDVSQFTVNRKTDIGYMLDTPEGEVFLHNNESMHQELTKGMLVDAFLYYDQKGRLAATLKTPYITVSRPGFLTVSAVHDYLGVFLDMGIAKELLLSSDDLPKDKGLWPQVGDRLYVSIKVKGKLVAKLISKEESRLIPEEPIELKSTVTAYVQKIGQAGANLLTLDGHWIFVHESQIKTELRYGQAVDVKVNFLSEKGYTGSLAPQKEVAIYDDANQVLSYIVRKGSMNLTADSSPEEIFAIFKMSKKAFKRAIGHLYKERKIDFIDGKTILVEGKK